MAWRIVLVALALAVSGCVAPFRAHVPDQVLEEAPPPIQWDVVRGGVTKDGAFTRIVETRYAWSGEGDGPPFPATLQVFSMRELQRRSTTDLMQLTEDIVFEAVTAQRITLDRSRDLEGERTLDGGLETQYFVREGTVREPGDLFDEDVRVRIIGEVGHDGRSKTSVIAVGLAQIATEVQCPVIGPCQGQRDMRSWYEIAGDREGSIDGASSTTALIYNLVTH